MINTNNENRHGFSNQVIVGVWRILCANLRKEKERSVMRIIWTLLLVASITSCANIGQTNQPIDTSISWAQRQSILTKLHQWDISGKIGVITAQNSGSASLKWLENNGYYTINLAGPLGAGAIALTGRPDNVTLKMANGQILSAPTPEQLLIQAWGWQLPVSHLKYWVRGLPVPNIAAKKQFDMKNRLSNLTQQNWHVSYTDYTTVGQVDLPSKITIQSANIKVKIALYQWQIN